MCSLLAFSFCLGLVLSAPLWNASVYCKAGLDVQYACTISTGTPQQWTARASLDTASINVTGWSRLVVETNAGEAKDMQAYASGYIEGFLSWDLVDLTWLSQANTLDHIDAKVADFVQQQLTWVLTTAQTQGPTDNTWLYTGLVLTQQQGLYDGYCFGSPDQHNPALSYNQVDCTGQLYLSSLSFLRLNFSHTASMQVLYMGMTTELGDIANHVGAPQPPPQFADGIAETHCSALVKITADFSDIFFSHDTVKKKKLM